MKGIYKKPPNSATKTIKATLQHLLFSFKYNTKITTDAHIINSPKKITNGNGKKIAMENFPCYLCYQFILNNSVKRMWQGFSLIAIQLLSR
jgi:deoxycytidylate deaminase